MKQTSSLAQGKLAQREWEEVVCPRCKGSGICTQCQSSGIVGMMGIPCALCGGGGERVFRRWDFGRFPPRRITVKETIPGSGRCSGCEGEGQVYRDRETGEMIQQIEGGNRRQH